MPSSSRRPASRGDKDLPPPPLPSPSFPTLQGSGSSAKVLYTLGAEPPPQPLQPPPAPKEDERRHLTLGNALAALRRPSPAPTETRSFRNLRKHTKVPSDGQDSSSLDAPPDQTSNLPTPGWSFNNINSSSLNLTSDDVSWDPARASPDTPRQDDGQLEAIVPWLYEVNILCHICNAFSRPNSIYFQPEPASLSPTSIHTTFNGSFPSSQQNLQGSYQAQRSASEPRGKRSIFNLIKRKRPSKDDDSMLTFFGVDRLSQSHFITGLRSNRSGDSFDAASLPSTSTRRPEPSKWSFRGRHRGSADDQDGISLDTDLEHMEGILHPNHLAKHGRSSSQPGQDGSWFEDQSRPATPLSQRPPRNTSLAPSDGSDFPGDRKLSVATSNLTYDSSDGSPKSFRTGTASRKGSAADAYWRPSATPQPNSRFAPRKNSSLSSTSLRRRSNSTIGTIPAAMPAGHAASGWTAPESWAVKPNQAGGRQESTGEDSGPDEDNLPDYRAPDGGNLPVIRMPTPTEGSRPRPFASRDVSSSSQARPGTGGSTSGSKSLQVRFE
jgi:hypothetical protein